MPKNFCHPIILIITLLFIFGCGQQENSEREKRETVSEDTSGMEMDEHADHDHVPMMASSDDSKTIRYWTCVMHPTVINAGTGELSSLQDGFNPYLRGGRIGTN